MSLQALVISAVSRALIKRRGLTDEAALRHLRRVFDHTPRVTLWPRGVQHRRVRIPALAGDLVTTNAPELTILYLHGGGFVAGRPRTYHNLTSRLALALQAEVYLPRYPLAPEWPFPAAHEHVVGAYRHLLSMGRNPRRIVIAGDSAGGGLTLSLLLAARDLGLPQPRCAVAMSPGANAQPSDAELNARCKGDAMLSADLIRSAIRLYLPDAEDRCSRYASLCDADFSGVAPLMITVSKDEILYADALRVRASAERAGVQVAWLERRGVCHVWPVLVPFLPEANRDLRRIIAFIRAPDEAPRSEPRRSGAQPRLS